ncbi:hypothetical protein ACAG96_08030 [Candidatus Izemoplasma sp. B36]|uniref:hypothetical protein n=1 Tax=Candidatus Izemoplasma sp. B36 TaxID=3242468 RepID=UPI003556E3B7
MVTKYDAIGEENENLLLFAMIFTTFGICGFYNVSANSNYTNSKGVVMTRGDYNKLLQMGYSEREISILSS